MFINFIYLNLKQWTPDSITRNLLEMQIPEPNPKPTESETLGTRPDAQLSPTAGGSDVL